MRDSRILENTAKKRFGPKSADHPSVGEKCSACHIPFVEGDFTTLITLGPGNDPEQCRQAKRGMAYTAVAVEVHWSCATGEET